MRGARKKIMGSGLGPLKKHVNKIRVALVRQADVESLADSLMQAVDSAYARAVLAVEEINPGKPASVHRARLAFKKFRLMVEIVSPLAPLPPEDYFENMHDYQSAMGDIRDTSVFLYVLADFSPEGHSRFDARPVRRYFQRQLSVLTAFFVAHEGELNTFWRPFPDQPFPWEKSASTAPQRRFERPAIH